jgi:DNA transposition AAA+ family ATPase
MISSWTLIVIIISQHGFKSTATTQQMIFLTKESCVETGNRLLKVYSEERGIKTKCIETYRIDVQ